MTDAASNVTLLELDSLDTGVRQALMVRLPSPSGRARLAFVPAGDPSQAGQRERSRLIAQLLQA
jgi:hypothetical protein